MQFYFQIIYDSKRIRLKAELIEPGDRNPAFEYWKVTAKNTEIIFQSNRPILEKNNLKKRAVEYKAIEQAPRYASVLELIREQLDAGIKRNERPDNRDDWKSHPKNR